MTTKTENKITKNIQSIEVVNGDADALIITKFRNGITMMQSVAHVIHDYERKGIDKEVPAELTLRIEESFINDEKAVAALLDMFELMGGDRKEAIKALERTKNRGVLWIR